MSYKHEFLISKLVLFFYQSPVNGFYNMVHARIQNPFNLKRTINFLFRMVILNLALNTERHKMAFQWSNKDPWYFKPKTTCLILLYFC